MSKWGLIKLIMIVSTTIIITLLKIVLISSKYGKRGADS
jgi:hypothetical protein